MDIVVLCQGGKPLVQPLMEHILHERYQTGSQRGPRELGKGILHLGCLDELGVADADATDIVLFELEPLDSGLHLDELFGVGLRAVCTVLDAFARHEVTPGEGLGIRFSKGGEDGIYVALEDGVRREEIDLAGIQSLPLLIEKIGDALEHDGGLAGAGNAVHEKDRYVLMADDGILLLLDRGRDGLELFGVVLLQGVEQKRILDSDRRIEIHPEALALKVELPSQKQLHLALLAIYLIGGLAHLLVVVGLGDRASPVDHDWMGISVHHAGDADIDVSWWPVRTHAQGDLCEVGLVQKNKHAAQLLYVEVMCLVVGIDDGVQGLDGGKGLHRLVFAAEVLGDLFGHVAQILRCCLVGDFEPMGELVSELCELLVGFAEMLLFLPEDRIVCELFRYLDVWHVDLLGAVRTAQREFSSN